MPASLPSPLSIARRRVLSLVSPNALLPLTCILGCTIVISIWLFYADRAEQEKTVARQAAITSSENIVLIVATNLAEVLGRANIYARIAASDGKSAPAAAYHLNPQLVGDSAYVRAAVFGGDGALLYSSANQAREPELQALLAAARSGPTDAPALSIGHPAANGKYPWLLPLLVRQDSAGGYYGAMVDLGYFLGSYRNVDLGPEGRIEIVHQDGAPLAIMQGGILLPAAGQPGAPPSALDAIVAREILADIPIRVAVIQDPAIVLGRLDAQHRSYFVRAGAYSLLVLIITIGISAGLWRQQKLYSAVALSEQEKQRLIAQLEIE